jgi:hypothetical protein
MLFYPKEKTDAISLFNYFNKFISYCIIMQVSPHCHAPDPRHCKAVLSPNLLLPTALRAAELSRWLPPHPSKASSFGGNASDIDSPLKSRLPPQLAKKNSCGGTAHDIYNIPDPLLPPQLT